MSFFYHIYEVQQGDDVMGYELYATPLVGIAKQQFIECLESIESFVYTFVKRILKQF